MKDPLDSTYVERIQHLRSIDQRRDPEAYHFILETLDSAAQEVISRDPASAFVSCRDLREAIRRHAAARFGLLAKTVLDDWGLCGPPDLGEMLNNLAIVGILAVEDGAVGEDFSAAGDFEESFDLRPMITYDGNRQVWTVLYVLRRSGAD